MPEHKCHCTYVEDRGQLCSQLSPSTFTRFSGLNSGHQAFAANDFTLRVTSLPYNGFQRFLSGYNTLWLLNPFLPLTTTCSLRVPKQLKQLSKPPISCKDYLILFVSKQTTQKMSDCCTLPVAKKIFLLLLPYKQLDGSHPYSVETRVAY